MTKVDTADLRKDADAMEEQEIAWREGGDADEIADDYCGLKLRLREAADELDALRSRPSGLALEWRADETGIIVFAYIGKHCCIGDVTEDFDGGWHAALWSMDAPDGREELVGPKQGLWDTEAEARAALEARARSALGVEDGAAGPIAEIAAERARQVAEEGWTPEHDDAHSRGEIAKAAGCYALMSAMPRQSREVAISEIADGARPALVFFRRYWPWAGSWFKPKDRRRDLIRAGALIVAEIERLDRAAARDADPLPNTEGDDG